MTTIDLSCFTGTENYWKNAMLCFQYTDGVKFLAVEANAYWLLTDISAFQRLPAVQAYLKRDYFQSWTLRVADNVGILTLTDGNGNVIHKHRYMYTDFPLSEVKFYLVDGVLMLVSEY